MQTRITYTKILEPATVMIIIINNNSSNNSNLWDNPYLYISNSNNS